MGCYASLKYNIYIAVDITIAHNVWFKLIIQQLQTAFSAISNVLSFMTI